MRYLQSLLIAASLLLAWQNVEAQIVSSLEAKTFSISSLAHAVDDHYNQLKSLKASFAEIYRGPGVTRNESGTLWLKKPGRMRWEYREPKEKLFLTDTENAYFYVPGERQARKTSLKKIDDLRSPLRYLLGKTKLEKELDHLSLAPDITALQPGGIVLRGVPKNMQDQVTEVLLEIAPNHQITRIVIQGVDGASTDFRFSGIEEDVRLPDSFFRFSLPDGVQMIHDDQGPR